jgi:hypothetical protein
MSYDMGRTLTFRTSDETLAHLEKRARQVRVAKTVLAERYVAEGLVMDSFPGLVFRDGPAGRRPALIGGPDVWEVIEVFHAEDANHDATAKSLGLRAGLVDAAIAYYATNREAVDEWIETNRELMEAARSPAASDRRTTART